MKGFARQLKGALEDNKGIETTVLVYVLAGVVLVISIGIAISAISGAGSLVTEGQNMSKQTMNKFATDYGVKELGDDCAEMCKQMQKPDGSYYAGGSCKDFCDPNTESRKYHSTCKADEDCCCA